MSRTKRRGGEKGVAFIVVLLILLFFSLVIPVTMSFLSSKTSGSQKSTEDTGQLYASDSGIEDALWQIKYDHLDTLFSSPTYTTPYAPYDYNTNTWTYNLSQQVNSEDVAVKIKNSWIPKDIDAPSPTEANIMISGSDAAHPPRLIVTGTALPPTGTPLVYTYQIKITYYPQTGENLKVEQLGIWLLRAEDTILSGAGKESASLRPENL
ncbi:MAG: hypothetical protein NTX46_03605 [Chloroflexi bacterium]|nr:hypothetical protein [Chloroflexota bacterium]